MMHFVGLSPAWQTIYEVDRLQPGELVRSNHVRTFPSGKATNAARHAAHLAIVDDQVTLHTGIGGDAGLLFERACRDEQFKLQATRTGAPLRCCTSVLDYGGKATELIENARPVSPGERASIVAGWTAGEDDVLVLCGSLPPGTPPTFYGELVAEHPGPTLVDAAGTPLLEAVRAGVTIAKPNRDELAATLDRAIESDEDMLEAAGELRELGADVVLVTDGPNPSLLMCEKANLWIKPPRPKFIRSVIGAGDAVTGALADGLTGDSGTLVIVTLAIAYAVAYIETLPPDPVSFDRLVELVEETELEIV